MWDYIRKPYECGGKYRNITHVRVLCGIISGNIMSGGKCRNITHVSVLCGIISGNIMSVEVLEVYFHYVHISMFDD